LSGIASEFEEDRGVIESYQQKMLEILQSSEYEQNVSEEYKNLALAGAYYSFARENVRFAKKETEWNEKEQLLDVSNHFIELASEIYREKDLDRYAKTYFVKSEILMLYNDINKLNQAKDLLKEGLVFCQEQQRRDNFIRISILLIKLNVQKMQMRAFHKMELEEIWKESKVIYNNVIQEISNHDYDNEYNKCREIIQNAYYDLEEVEKDLYNYKENAYFDEEERINIEQRIDLIQDLKRKYGNNIEEILEYQKDVKEQIETIENLSDYIEQIKNEKTEIEKELQELSTKMHDLRQIYSNKMSEQINTELQDLEMRNARFYVQIENREEFNINGKDNIEFLISTNIGEEKKPLIKIASGGEMSRIMLGIKKVLADIDQVPVLIFDEIDTGISGIAAKKVGIKMKEISKKHQVICVTHLAQIAAKGDYNYFIKKEVKDNKTNTKIEQLTEEGTIREIARIATGEINEISLKHAKELRKEKVA